MEKEYLTILQEDLSTILDTYYPKLTPENDPSLSENDKMYYKDNPERYARSHHYKVTVSDQDSMGVNISILTLANGHYLLKFYLKHVEACCAMSFFHSFYHNPSVNEDFLREVLNKVVKWGGYHVGGCKNKRWIVNMVEDESRRQADPTKSVEYLPEAKIQFPKIHAYFVKNAKVVNRMLMPNYNTGRIIHHMEVVF